MYDIPLSTFKEALGVIKGKALRTPLIQLSGHKSIYLKAECLQPGGSFKIRGAIFCMSRIPHEVLKNGVIAYSTGNHAQAVALVAQQLKIPATIVMSPEVPAFKVERTREYGAEVVMAPQGSVARMKVAKALAKDLNLTLIPSYDNLDIIAGQGTIGLEILEDIIPEYVFVPVGGGGLIAGIAMAIKKTHPKIKIFGVEPELEDDACQTFKKGYKVRMDHVSNSIADAIKIQELGDIAYPIMQTYVDEMISVSEPEIIEAIKLSLDRGHLFVEPSGALALAGALKYAPPHANSIVCIASGGNTLWQNLCKIVKS
ncbi:MAG: threonine/serine dehydratase [Chlamydiales bacterium]|nr:threonine/serine dehydratase [Chlamydiales bacterium]